MARKGEKFQLHSVREMQIRAPVRCNFSPNRQKCKTQVYTAELWEALSFAGGGNAKCQMAQPVGRDWAAYNQTPRTSTPHLSNPPSRNLLGR